MNHLSVYNHNINNGKYMFNTNMLCITKKLFQRQSRQNKEFEKRHQNKSNIRKRNRIVEKQQWTKATT